MTFVDLATIKSIYYAIFHSDLSYVCTALGQNLNSKHRINLLQKKAMRIISFASFDAHTLPIFVKLNIIKFTSLFSFCKSPSVFSNAFVLRSNAHEQNTRSALHGLLTKPSCSISKYSINAFAASAIKSWNFSQKRFSNNNLCQLSYSQLKLLIKNHFFNSYNQECS